jgi:hypothetical protein
MTNKEANTMTTFDIYRKLKEAYETSTHNHNRFAETINSIRWNDHFEADGEHYYKYGDLLFITPTLNPFEVKSWNRPSFFFSDNSHIRI